MWGYFINFSLTAMKKVIILLILFSSAFALQGQKQILVAEDGNNATFEMNLDKHEDKELVVSISLSWVDDNLKPLENTNSTIVLKEEDIHLIANQPVNIKEFSDKNEIRFQSDAKLHLVYQGKDLDKLTMEVVPSYSASPKGASERFLIAHPSKITKSFTKLSGPQIFITSPRIGTERGMKPLVENQKVQIKGYVKTKTPLAKFTIWGKQVKLSGKGEFEHEIELARKGENGVWLIAKDLANNVSSVKLTLDYRPPLTEQDLEEIDYYALIITAEQYQDQMIIDLDFPIADAKALIDVLTTKYDFEKDKIMYLENATNSQIVKSLDSLAKVITNFDNLLIFYAGHGYWDENTEIGYWMPSDAQISDKSTWFRNSSLRDHIKAIKSNHTLLIADACFSGGIFKTRGAFDNASYGITKLYNMPSRKAMTSGTLKEVPDKSVFIKYLLKRLHENEKTFISAAELFSSFRAAVLNNSPNVPQYGMIQNSGDEGGEFIFIKK